MLSVSAKEPSGLTAVLTEDDTVSRFLLSMHYTLSLKNETASPIQTRQFHETLTGAFDVPGSLIIYDGSGNPVYPGSTPPPPPIQGQWENVTIPAGGVLTKQISVEEDVKPGPYHAYAHFDTDTGGTVVGPLNLTVIRPL